MSDIFVSYASEDIEYARLLAEVLEARGWSTWWDRSIPAGASYRRVIGEELAAARCVVVIWSGRSLESDWVHDEAEEGFRRGILVPVLIENVSLPLGFRSVQTANIVNWTDSKNSDDLDRLVSDIALMLDAPSQATRTDRPGVGDIPSGALNRAQEPSGKARGKDPSGSPALREQKQEVQAGTFWGAGKGRTVRLVSLVGVGIVAIASVGVALATFTLASVSQDDVLDSYGWIDASRVDNPVPGQLYVISGQNIVRAPLCKLTKGDVSIDSREIAGARFVNVLGEAVPILSSVVPHTLKWSGVTLDTAPLSALNRGIRRILEEPNIDKLRASLDQETFEEVIRLETCARAIVSNLEQGLPVCQLTAVAAKKGEALPFGVDFADNCLTTAEAGPMSLPDVAHRPLSTRLKASLGLIEQRPL